MADKITHSYSRNRWPWMYVCPVVDSFPTAKASRTGTIVKIVDVAYREWRRGGGQQVKGNTLFYKGKRETDRDYYKVVGEYWLSLTRAGYTGKSDKAWSAAFISYVMREAGVDKKDFKGASSHTSYMHDAVMNTENKTAGAKFLGHKLQDYAPIVGDLVCYSRENKKKTYDDVKALKVDKGNRFDSHCDIVVYKRGREIGVIGGNVKDGVSLKMLATDTDGILTDANQDWFLAIENKLPAI